MSSCCLVSLLAFTLADSMFPDLNSDLFIDMKFQHFIVLSQKSVCVCLCVCRGGVIYLASFNESSHEFDPALNFSQHDEFK